MTILNSTLKLSNLQKVLSVSLYLRLKALANRAIGKRSKIAKNQKIRLKKMLKKSKQRINLSRSIIYIRNCQNQAY